MYFEWEEIHSFNFKSDYLSFIHHFSSSFSSKKFQNFNSKKD
jgi:hypothetical protein